MIDVYVIVAICIVFIAMCYVMINQMLMVNAVNKRLMTFVEGVLNAGPAMPFPMEDDGFEDGINSFDPHNVDEV